LARLHSETPFITREPSRTRRSLSADPHPPLPMTVCSRASPCFERRPPPALSPGTIPGTAKRPEPLCPEQALPAPARRLAPSREALPSLPSSYGLMRGTKSLPPPSDSTSFGRSLRVAVSPRWEMALPDVISASPSLNAWACPAAAREVLLPVSSLTTSAFPTKPHVGRRTQQSAQRLQSGGGFRRHCHSPIRSGLQRCLPPRSLPPQQSSPPGSRGVFSGQNVLRYLLPPYAPDQLAVRFRAIDGRGLSPHRTRSLVGCFGLSPPAGGRKGRPFLRAPGPRRTRPGLAPVCWPSSRT
jgi:hypothetical protein